jgi:hypothetical protein
LKGKKGKKNSSLPSFFFRPSPSSSDVRESRFTSPGAGPSDVASASLIYRSMIGLGYRRRRLIPRSMTGFGGFLLAPIARKKHPEAPYVVYITVHFLVRLDNDPTIYSCPYRVIYQRTICSHLPCRLVRSSRRSRFSPFCSCKFPRSSSLL